MVALARAHAARGARPPRARGVRRVALASSSLAAAAAAAGAEAEAEFDVVIAGGGPGGASGAVTHAPLAFPVRRPGAGADTKRASC